MRSQAKAPSTGSTKGQSRVRMTFFALALVAFTAMALTPASQAAPSRTELPALSQAVPNAACAAAVDPAGYLYVSSNSIFAGATIKVYSPAGAALTEFTLLSGGCPIEVDAAGDIFVVQNAGTIVA